MPRVTRNARLVAYSREVDHYEVLQVSRYASSDVIHAAYRALARSVHPDLNKGEEATQMMRGLNAAYEELCDPVRRAAYDARARTETVLHSQHIRARERLSSRERRRDALVERVAARGADRNGVIARGRTLPTVAITVAVVFTLVVTFWAMSTTVDDGPVAGPLAPGPESSRLSVDRGHFEQLITDLDPFAAGSEARASRTLDTVTGLP